MAGLWTPQQTRIMVKISSFTYQKVSVLPRTKKVNVRDKYVSNIAKKYHSSPKNVLLCSIFVS